ncbi:MAG: NAD-dependent epimerase/dehydratase family protein [Nanoarchaeota archaeon]
MIEFKDFFLNKTVMITGGLGFIGSNMAHKFVSLNPKRIIIVDNLIEGCGGSMENIRGIEDKVEVVKEDIGSEKVAELVKDVDFVFNLAGQTGHSVSMENPVLDLELNYLSHLNFLESCRKNNPTVVIIFASTRQFYGVPKFLPVNEEHLINPPDVNGINKWAAEQLHLLYSKVYGIRACSLRLTNIFGPRQRIKDAKLGVLPFFLGISLKGESISLFEPGTQIRDINYVDDVVDAFLVAAQFIDKTKGEAFNVGGEKICLVDFVKLIIEINGGSYILKPFPPEKKKIDIGDYYSDYSKFSNVTGWHPITGLKEGVEKSLDFYKENREIYLK